MYYPVITSLQIEEARQRDGLAPDTEHRQPVDFRSSIPSRWDYLLLHLGDWLIVAGKRVRNGSAYVRCCESKMMQVNPSGGKV